jgi:hypothetical protein
MKDKSAGPGVVTLGGAAKAIGRGCKAWKIRRLFERGILPEPARLGLYRVLATNELPRVTKALESAGYLSKVPTRA